MSAPTGSPKLDASTPQAKLTIGEKDYVLPILVGTENDRAIDISKLLKDTGHTTIDDGFANTAAASSSITYLDGDRGITRPEIDAEINRGAHSNSRKGRSEWDQVSERSAVW